MDSNGFKDDGLLLVIFDESESGADSCCNEKASNTPNAGGPTPGSGGGKTGAVAISPFIKPASVDKTPYNHYSMLRGVEDLLGLEHLGYAGVAGLVPLGPNLFNQTPALQLSVTMRRRGRNHVRFSADAGRQATISFGGVCKGSPSRPTSEEGKRTITVRYSRGGECRVAASRPAWQTATKSFRLRAPRR